jgi:hypothetical protein
MGGSFRNMESSLTRTTTGFFVARFITVTRLFEASVEITVPAM